MFINHLFSFNSILGNLKISANLLQLKLFKYFCLNFMQTADWKSVLVLLKLYNKADWQSVIKYFHLILKFLPTRVRHTNSTTLFNACVFSLNGELRILNTCSKIMKSNPLLLVFRMPLSLIYL